MKTTLFEKHQSLGAKFVSFGGWEMPVQYKGIILEHNAVRKAVGLFDVSHMGRILVSGKDAEKYLDYLSTNLVSGKKDLSAIYTVWCYPQGGCVDDVIVFRRDSYHYFVIVNAANRKKDLEHMKKYAQGFDVTIQDRFDQDGILAIQGPNSSALIAECLDLIQLPKHMHFQVLKYKGNDLILSRTGYTGSDGFEIYAPIKTVVELWEMFLQKGKRYGIEPVGLGARDTLRIEAGYSLYGHEISETISPLESISAWTVKLDKHEFLGKEGIKDYPSHRSEYGVVLKEQGVPREGYEVLKNDQVIGKVTSGTFSPSLNRGIAIVLVEDPLGEGDIVHIVIRQQRIEAKVVKIPFIDSLK